MKSNQTTEAGPLKILREEVLLARGPLGMVSAGAVDQDVYGSQLGLDCVLGGLETVSFEDVAGHADRLSARVGDTGGNGKRAKARRGRTDATRAASERMTTMVWNDNDWYSDGNYYYDPNEHYDVAQYNQQLQQVQPHQPLIPGTPPQQRALPQQELTHAPPGVIPRAVAIP